MKMTHWTEKRLARLFATYNARYWRGRVPKCPVRIAKPESGENWLGRCDFKKREILIDAKAHRSDQEIRQTMLHEMAHAAARHERVTGGHGYRFFAQIELLLRQGARITLNSPEAPHLRIFHNAVPRRFPLARKAIERLEAARVRPFLQLPKGITVHDNTEDEIVAEFRKLSYMAPWSVVLACVGNEYGLLDVGGKPNCKPATRIIAKAKKAFHTARRDYLGSEKFLKKIRRS